MKFKPVTEKYIFDTNELIRTFPAHLKIPVATWIQGVLENSGIWTSSDWHAINENFLNELDLHLREITPFPRNHNDFLPFVLDDDERTINIIALCLQNYATADEARLMEHILSKGGSAYAVMFMVPKTQPYDRGVSDIIERVPEVVRISSEEILDKYSLVKEAWHSCYSQNPNYAITVDKCVDALEGLYKKHYFSNDKTTNLSKYVCAFKKDPSVLSFQGDNLVDFKNNLTDFSSNFVKIRGHHTSGTGKLPTKEEAVFVLHYTIFIIQIHS